VSAPVVNVYDVILIGRGWSETVAERASAIGLGSTRPVAAAVGEGSAVVWRMHEHLALAKR
jgi:hypothetical protein